MSVTVSTLLEESPELKFTVLAGNDGLNSEIDSDRIQKSGLAMTGYTHFISPGWVQVLGNSELSYLRTQPEDRGREILEALCDVDVPCIIVTRDLEVPPVLIELCEKRNRVLLTTRLITGEFIRRVQAKLERMMAPSVGMHGVLVDVFGVGVLLLGPSGVGKSECALDLVLRGHKLVADDIVDIHRLADLLVGSGYDLIKYHMEIRGIGIINVRDLFGIAAVRDSKKIELCIELVDWDQGVEYERLGIEERSYTILGVDVPHLIIPVRPGRPISSVVEVAARNQLLKLQGHHSAVEFQKRLMNRIAKGVPPMSRADGVE